jgi:hypothetical protein
LFCGEVLDLLTPSQCDLRVEMGPQGAQVRNLTRAHVRDEQDFLRLLLQAAANRTQRQSVFGPLSTRASTRPSLTSLTDPDPDPDLVWAPSFDPLIPSSLPLSPF